MPPYAPVTAIVRTRNRPVLLAQALDSLVRQECPPQAVVVVNDGGCDVSAVLARFPGLTIHSIVHDTSRGRSAAGNAGLDALATPFALFLDDDDWIEPSHIAGLHALLAATPEAPAAYAGVACVHVADDGCTRAGHIFNLPFDRHRLLTENYLPIHGVLFRCDAIERAGLRLDERLEAYEDWDFWLRLSAQGDFAHLDAVTAHYRVAGDGGFGGTPGDAREADALARFFALWRTRWSDDDLLAIVRAAKHRPMYEELRNLLDRQDAQLHGVLAERDALATDLDTERQALADLHERHAALGRHAEEIAEHAEDLNEKVDYLLHANTIAESELQRLRQHIDELLGSTSWRLTRPLRGAVRAARALRRGLPVYSRKSLTILRDEGPSELVRRTRAKLGRRPPQERLPRHFGLAESCGPLSLPTTTDPQLSVWLHAAATPRQVYTAVAAMAGAAPRCPWELLVTVPSDAGEVRAMLAGIQGARVFDTAATGSWAEALRVAADAAAGTRLLVLDAYCAPLPGAVQSLYDTLDQSAVAWLVSPRLLTPEGRLRAAGCILWRSGALSQYGDGDDPTHPQYHFVRPLDGVGAQGALIDLKVLRTLGQATTDRSLTADYLLSGLNLHAQAQGRIALYQPEARLVVFPAPELTPEQRETSRAALKSAWRARLAQQPPVGSLPLRARDRVRKRVLIIDVITPLDDQDSGSLRMVRLMTELQGLGCHVAFLPTNVEYTPPYTGRLQQAGVEMLYAPHVWSLERYLESHGAAFDAIIVSRLIAADKILPMARHLVPKARLIYDTVDLHYLREQRAAALSGDAEDLAKAKATQARELGHMLLADLTWVVSPVEREILADTLPGVRVEVLSNIHEIHPAEHPFSQRHGLVFIGSFNHPPNEDAMLWFVADIWPRIVERIPGIRLHIVGSRPTRAVQALAGAQIKVTGFVADIRPYFAQCRLSIAPLRYGAGVKGKINTAMAYGLPVVATSPAAEGMWLTHEKDVLMADNAADFAEQVIRAYNDETLWTQLAAGGFDNIRNHFSRERARTALSRALGLDGESA